MKIGDTFDGGTIVHIGEPSLYKGSKDKPNAMNVTIEFPGGRRVTHVASTVRGTIYYANVGG